MKTLGRRHVKSEQTLHKLNKKIIMSRQIACSKRALMKNKEKSS